MDNWVGVFGVGPLTLMICKDSLSHYLFEYICALFSVKIEYNG